MSESFIKVGSTRIKRKNIKTFGTSVRKVEVGGINDALGGLISGEGFWNNFFYHKKSLNYLYITTYQNDNYQFTEKEIKIREVIKELESI